MNELEELAHALMHQADACYLTVVNNQRLHAYSIIGGLATLETRLYSKGHEDLADLSQKAIKNCLRCIRSTASTGRCYRCSKEIIKEIEEGIKNARKAEWTDLLEEQKKKGETSSSTIEKIKTPKPVKKVRIKQKKK